MAIGQVLKFSGVGTDKYDAVRVELGWDDEKGAPSGLLAHAVGKTDEGFCVIEWWDSEGDWGHVLLVQAATSFRQGRGHAPT